MIGLSLRDHRVGVGPRRALTSVRSRFRIRLTAVLARLDQQLAVVAADVEPQEVDSPGRGATIRVLSSLKTSPLGASHSASRRLDLLGLLTGVTQGDKIVGVADQHRGSPAPSHAGRATVV